MRTNKHRETILTILKNQHGGLTATGVHSALPEVNLTTIYRNLDSLTLIVVRHCMNIKTTPTTTLSVMTVTG
jgi:Fe2+ or Zn2+ uptake regulation protein